MDLLELGLESSVLVLCDVIRNFQISVVILKVLFLHLHKVIERLSLRLLFYTEYQLSQLLSFELIQVLRNALSSHERVACRWVLSHVCAVLARYRLAIIQNRSDQTSPHGTLRLSVSRHAWLNIPLWHLLLILLRYLIEILLLLHVIRVLVLGILPSGVDPLWELSTIVSTLTHWEASVIVSRILLSRLLHSSLPLTTGCLPVLDLLSLWSILRIHVVLIIDDQNSIIVHLLLLILSHLSII